jgi:hypothetical protein
MKGFLTNCTSGSVSPSSKKKLEDKATEFGDDPHETYLRITLGHSLGKSPGIPYVLEIWPKSNYSPMHNHGNRKQEL